MSKNVSIIIPVFNTSDELIVRCINSCLEQAYRDYEIIIVDDGSTDIKTIQTLEHYRNAENIPIRIFTITNCGASLARKHGVENCNGPFIFFLDADDYLEENALEVLVKEQETSNFDVVVGQFNIVSSTNTRQGRQFKISQEEDSIIKSFLISDLPGTLWPNLFKKELFNTVTFYNFPVGEDLVINAQIFTQESLKIAVIDDVIYNYYQHDGSLTKVITEEKIIQGNLAYQKSLQIIEERADIKNLGFEICINKLNNLYALIVLHSDKSKFMLKNIKKTDMSVLKRAIKTFSLTKRVLFSTLIYLPLTLNFFMFVIKKIRTYKSN